MKITINGTTTLPFQRIDLEYITPTVSEEIGVQGDVNIISNGAFVRQWTVKYEPKSMTQADYDVWTQFASPYVTDIFPVIIEDNEGVEKYNGNAFIKQVGSIDRRIGKYGVTFQIIEKRT